MTSETSWLIWTARESRRNPSSINYHYADFGILAEEENTFDGYTIATRLRAGWYSGTGRFGSEGEFFRATIDDAKYHQAGDRSEPSAFVCRIRKDQDCATPPCFFVQYGPFSENTERWRSDRLQHTFGSPRPVPLSQ